MTMAQQALSILNSITEEQIRDTAWWDDHVRPLNGYDDQETIEADVAGESTVVCFSDGSRAVYDVSGDEWVARDQDNYRVIRYGGNGITEDRNPHDFRLIREARAYVKGCIGVYFDDAECKWNGNPGEVEAYNESDVEGCGGYAIERL